MNPENDQIQETDDQKLARFREAKAKREEEAKRQARANELARFELAEKYERELGREGIDFAIYDGTRMGIGFVVLKRGDAIRWQVFSDSKMTPADRFDFVEGCIVHPSKEVYLAAREKFPAVDLVLTSELSALYGFRAKEFEGK